MSPAVVAQPAKPSAPPVTAPLLHLDTAPNVATTPTDRVPGMTGDVSARILVPPDHPDARPWPLGMLITPPETGDHNVLVPGLNSLPFWKFQTPGAPVTKQLIDGLNLGVGTMVELLVPPQL
ncbi:MAG TPA: hypothetical protein VFQ53_06265 [Kofleriaceae bacterium]|nr:hypothetical protein [Kofleriaceae bacterium]